MVDGFHCLHGSQQISSQESQGTSRLCVFLLGCPLAGDDTTCLRILVSNVINPSINHPQYHLFLLLTIPSHGRFIIIGLWHWVYHIDPHCLFWHLLAADHFREGHIIFVLPAVLDQLGAIPKLRTLSLDSNAPPDCFKNSWMGFSLVTSHSSLVTCSSFPRK